MKAILKIAQALAITVAGFFSILAFVVLFADGVIIDRFLDFSIFILPGIVIVFVTVFFKHYYKILGLMYVGIGMIYFFFFRPYMNISQGWPMMLLVILPLIIAGIINMTYKEIKTTEEVI